MGGQDGVVGLVINHESTVRVLKGGMGGQDGVVGLNNSSGHLRCGINGEFQFGFLAVINAQAFHQKRSETRSGTATKGVENQESLKTGAVVSQFTDTIQDQVNNLLANGVVSTSIVVSGILLTSHQLLRVEQLTVSSSADFVDDSGLQINKDSSGYVFSRSSLGEKGIERVIPASNGFVRRHLSIRLDSVFQAIEFPASIAHLATGLADMNRDTFTWMCGRESLGGNHFEKVWKSFSQTKI